MCANINELGGWSYYCAQRERFLLLYKSNNTTYEFK